ncbi:MAG: MinD/ParA family protein [Rhodoferax sp.]|uniref:AAA family ATPase n=1 Tax=Rhodoferax sp. TaxID=50421 RepID=UPI00180C7525|nr:AAA family ATPase [Rhodoferax sp.]NMM20012.1 MinD/ParA family protein [Rhodoferax sp.]
MTIKVSVICTSEAILAALNIPDPTRTGVVFVAHAGSVQALASVLRKEQPDVVLLDLPVADERVMEQIESALMKAPGTHMVLVSPDRSVEFLTRAMRAGVREVLPAPMSAMTVQQVVKNAQGHTSVSSRHRDRVGQVLALIPAKGGAGTTFLATNLAYALSKQGKRVAVLDLNLYFGDVAIFLSDKKVVTSVVDLARQAQRLDSALLDSSMIKVSEHLHVLAASESPEDANEVSPAGVERIIELARSQYDFVVLDVSNTLDPVAVKVLDLADTIYLTLQLSLPFVHAAKRMVAVFRVLGYLSDKLRIVVNRYEKGGDIDLADVEKATMLKIGRTIPNSHISVSASVNQGVPLLEMAPRDPVARALHDWAQELAPVPVQPNKGWLHGLMASSP